MVLRYRYLRWMVIILLMLGIGAGLPLLREHQRHTLPQRPYGRYTAKQILDRSQTLCLMLVPEANTLRLSAQPTAVGANLPAWSVGGSDASGRDRIHLTFWNLHHRSDLLEDTAHVNSLPC